MRWYNEENQMRNENTYTSPAYRVKSLSLFVMQEHGLHKGQYLKEASY